MKLFPVNDFNLIQDRVIVQDIDGDGLVGPGDRAIAQRDFTLGPGSRGPTFCYRVGQEVPYEDYRFLLEALDPGRARAWRLSGERRFLSLLESRYQVRLRPMPSGSETEARDYQVYDRSGDFRWGMVTESHCRIDPLRFEDQLFHQLAAGRGMRPRSYPPSFLVSPTAQEVLDERKWRIEADRFGKIECLDAQGRRRFSYVPQGLEERVILRYLSSACSAESFELVALFHDGKTVSLISTPTNPARNLRHSRSSPNNPSSRPAGRSGSEPSRCLPNR